MRDLNPTDPDEDALTPAEREMEAALGGLAPARPAWGRDRLLFEAGRAAGESAARRSVLAWRAAAAVLFVGLGLVAVARMGVATGQGQRVVYVTTAPAATHKVEDVGDPSSGGPQDSMTAAPEDHLLTSFRRPLIPSADSDYLQVRDAVLRWGVRVMPAARAGGGPASAAREPTLDSLLGTPAPKPAPARRIDLKGLFFGDRL